MAGGWLTVGETAHLLGVSPRHVRRLADQGAITRMARGLIDRDTIHQYLAAGRQGRSRAWAEHTTWTAVALLSGHDADWLGATQTSRLRSALRRIRDVDELITRMRDRAVVSRHEAHRAALGRLREHVIRADWRQLGLADPAEGAMDGYVAAAELDRLTHMLGLHASVTGRVVLRASRFDFDQVQRLVGSRVVAALDAATSTDPRAQGAGRAALIAELACY